MGARIFPGLELGFIEDISEHFLGRIGSNFVLFTQKPF
jgi:hypothetical protein